MKTGSFNQGPRVLVVDDHRISRLHIVQALRQAVDTQDAETLSRKAHSLKGMLRNFKAESAADTALELEKLGKANKLQNVESLIEKLEAQIAGVSRSLKDLVSQKSEG